MESLRFIRYTLRLILIFLPMAAAVVLFQNCSRVRNGTIGGSESAKGGGTGTDGKLYASYGRCPNGSVGVSSVVKIPDDRGAFLLRQNCQSLDTPQPVAISDLKFAAKDSSVMTLKSQLYDLQTNMPKVTMELCRSVGASPAVEAKVWKVSGDTGSFYGSIVLEGGNGTGTLKVVPPDGAAPLDFVTTAGQSGGFDLALTSASGGSLTYSLAGGSPVSVPVMNCSYQTLPGPFPNATNTGVPQGKTLGASGGMTVTVDGTVIDSKLVTGCIDVRADNVTIRNSRILGGNCSQPVSINAPFKGLLVEDSEIDGQNTATCSQIIGGGGYTLLRVYAHGCDQGPRLVGPFSIVIQDSYVANRSHGSQAYGLSLAAGNSVKFIHNTIETANGPAIFTADNSTGDLIIDSNLLVAANYPLSLYDNRAWVRNNLIFDNSDGHYDNYYGPVVTFFGDKEDPGLTIMEWTNNHFTSKRDGSVVGGIISEPAPN